MKKNGKKVNKDADFLIVGGFANSHTKVRNFAQLLASETGKIVDWMTLDEFLLLEQQEIEQLQNKTIITHSVAAATITKFPSSNMFILNAPHNDGSLSSFVRHFIKRETKRIHKNNGALRGGHHITMRQIKHGYPALRQGLTKLLSSNSVSFRIIEMSDDELFRDSYGTHLSRDVITGLHDHIFDEPDSYVKQLLQLIDKDREQ